MSNIITIRIQTGERTRDIETLTPADSVTVVFDSGREVIITPSSINAGDGQIVELNAEDGSSFTSVDNGGIYQKVTSGRDSYVAGRDGTWLKR